MGTTVNDIKAIIKEAIPQINEEELKDAIPLRDQNIDSLDLFNILMRLEETYNIKIPDEDAAELRNIVDIVNYIHTKKEEISL